LVRLRTDAAIDFTCQAMFEAIEIKDAVFNTELPAKFCAELPVAS
jgi:hypothetical protein